MASSTPPSVSSVSAAWLDDEPLREFHRGGYTYAFFTKLVEQEAATLPLRSFTDPLRAFLDPDAVPAAFVRQSRDWVARFALSCLGPTPDRRLLDCGWLPGGRFILQAARWLAKDPALKVLVPYTHLVVPEDDHAAVLAHVCLYTRPTKAERAAGSSARRTLIATLQDQPKALLLLLAILAPSFSGIIAQALADPHIHAWVSALHAFNGFRVFDRRRLLERCREDLYALPRTLDDLAVPRNPALWQRLPMPRLVESHWREISSRFTQLPEILRLALPKSHVQAVSPMTLPLAVSKAHPVRRVMMASRHGWLHPSEGRSQIPSAERLSLWLDIIQAETRFPLVDAVDRANQFSPDGPSFWITDAGDPLLIERKQVQRLLDAKPPVDGASVRLLGPTDLSGEPLRQLAWQRLKGKRPGLDQLWLADASVWDVLLRSYDDTTWQTCVPVSLKSTAWLSALGFARESDSWVWRDSWYRRVVSLWPDDAGPASLWNLAARELSPEGNWRTLPASAAPPAWLGTLWNAVSLGWVLSAGSEAAQQLALSRWTSLAACAGVSISQARHPDADTWILSNSVREFRFQPAQLAVSISPPPRQTALSGQPTWRDDRHPWRPLLAALAVFSGRLSQSSSAAAKSRV